MIAHPSRSQVLSIIGGAVVGVALNLLEPGSRPASAGHETDGNAGRSPLEVSGQSVPGAQEDDRKLAAVIVAQLKELTAGPESEASADSLRARFAALYQRNPAMAFSIIDELPAEHRATALMKLAGPSRDSQRALCANEALKRGYLIGSNDSRAVKSLMQDAAAQNFTEYLGWLKGALQSDHSEIVADHFAYPLPPKPEEIAGLLDVYLSHVMKSGTQLKNQAEVLVFASLVPAEQLGPIIGSHLKAGDMPKAGREALLARFSALLASHEPGVANEIARTDPSGSRQLLQELAAAGTLERATVDHLSSNGMLSDAQRDAISKGGLINSLKTDGDWKTVLRSMDVTKESAPWITQQLSMHNVSPGELLSVAQSTPGASGDLLEEAYIGAWAKVDVVGASAQLAQLPQPADGAIMAVTREIESDPAAAYLWSRRLSDGGTRTRECDRFLGLLSRTDPAAAEQLREQYPVEPLN